MMRVINKIKKWLGIKDTKSIIKTYEPIFDKLRIESDGYITKVYINDIEQHYITKIELYQSAGEKLNFNIEKDIRH